MAMRQRESDRLLSLSFELQGMAFRIFEPSDKRDLLRAADLVRELAQVARDAELAGPVVSPDHAAGEG